LEGKTGVTPDAAEVPVPPGETQGAPAWAANDGSFERFLAQARVKLDGMKPRLDDPSITIEELLALRKEAILMMEEFKLFDLKRKLQARAWLLEHGCTAEEMVRLLPAGERKAVLNWLNEEPHE
jgi:hypothetical protein